MGLNAEIFAIGTFRKEIIPFLQYPPSFYEKTREGVAIAEALIFIGSGTTESRELASCFGIDPWDFNQHALDPWSVDLERLRKLCSDTEVQAFLGLRDAGFRFFFLPNG